MVDIEEQVRSAMLVNGITPPENIYVDGKKHRFSTNGNPKDTAGEYCIYPDNIPAGYFIDYRTGVCNKWRHNSQQSYTPNELKKLDETTKARIIKEKEEHENAIIKFKNIWNNALDAPENFNYLVIKSVKVYGIKIYKNRLIIPIKIGEKIISLQHIDTDGNKQFSSKGRTKGGSFLIGIPKDIICFVEGYATGATVHEATGYAVVVVFSCGNLSAVADEMRNKFPNAIFIFCADNDIARKVNHGLEAAQKAAKLVNGHVAVPVFNSGAPSDASDFNDMASISGLGSVKMIIEATLTVAINNTENHTTLQAAPIPLPDPWPKVAPFNFNMLPETIRDYVEDVSNRMQSPPDYIAVTLICSFAAVLGNKVLMRPKQNDDWTVTPNQWGIIIGRPSAMKSPCMKEALKPLYTLEQEFSNNYAQEQEQYEINVEILEAESDKSILSRKIKIGDRVGAEQSIKDRNNQVKQKPIRKRIIVNDSTVEKLGELLNDNPNGLLMVRDELSGWISHLNKEDNQSERAFYLQCFDGDGRYTYDRIKRGTIEIANCTLSIIGGIQPNKITPLIRGAIFGAKDDGLVQRLQLSVWPDEHQNWSWQDYIPNTQAYQKYNKAILDLYNLNCKNHLSFSTDAQQMFIEWMNEIQQLARSEDIHPVLESHLLKMPKTIAGLALLFELISGGRECVGAVATAMALEWADYLKSHAERLYSSILNVGVDGAYLLLKRKDKLLEPFTARDLCRKKWKGINSIEDTIEVIQCLIDHNYLRTEKTPKSDSGGRPTFIYKWIN